VPDENTPFCRGIFSAYRAEKRPRQISRKSFFARPVDRNSVRSGRDDGTSERLTPPTRQRKWAAHEPSGLQKSVRRAGWRHKDCGGTSRSGKAGGDHPRPGIPGRKRHNSLNELRKTSGQALRILLA